VEQSVAISQTSAFAKPMKKDGPHVRVGFAVVFAGRLAVE
jgi:hypothetical protein